MKAKSAKKLAPKTTTLAQEARKAVDAIKDAPQTAQERVQALIDSGKPALERAQAFASETGRSLSKKSMALRKDLATRVSDLGTRVEKELQQLLARGGVIGGSSAGAMIQGSFLLFGGPTLVERLSAFMTSKPAPSTDNSGFGFLENTVIAPHVRQWHTAGGLSKIVSAHPELLGLGLDAGTAIVVHGRSFEVIGGADARVVVTDGKQHDGKPYYFLKLGDRFNLDKRAVE